jgi:hypothetical protein
MPEAKPGTVSVKMEPGLPGIPEYLITVFGKDGKELGPPSGSPGKYEAVFTTWRGTVRPIGEYEVTQGDNIRGDSHLMMAKPAYKPPGNPDANEFRMALQTDRGEKFEIVGTANDKGFLAKVAVKEFDAASFHDAHEKAYRAATVMLSNLSLQLDMPLLIFQQDIQEVSTGSHWMVVVNPSFEIPPLIDSAMTGSAEFRSYASIYREALNTNSLLYMFLCLYKITEGIRKKRVAKEREAAKKGKEYRAPAEVVPRDSAEFVPWLNSLYSVAPEWKEWHLGTIFGREAGRRFLDLIGEDGPMTKLRNEIGHAFTASSGKEVTNLDSRGFQVEVERWLPLLKCMARRMLRNEFPTEFLPWLKDEFRDR